MKVVVELLSLLSVNSLSLRSQAVVEQLALTREAEEHLTLAPVSCLYQHSLASEARLLRVRVAADWDSS